MKNDNVQTLDQYIQRLSTNDVASRSSLFLTVYALNLFHRFPAVTELSTIPTDEIREVARFSAVTAMIGLDVWDEICNRNEVKDRTELRRTA